MTDSIYILCNLECITFISLHSLHTLLDPTASILFTYDRTTKYVFFGMLKLHSISRHTISPISILGFQQIKSVQEEFLLSCVVGLVARSHRMSYPKLVQWWPDLQCQFGGNPPAVGLMNHQPMYLQQLTHLYCSRTTVPERVNKVSQNIVHIHPSIISSLRQSTDLKDWLCINFEKSS